MSFLLVEFKKQKTNQHSALLFKPLVSFEITPPVLHNGNNLDIFQFESYIVG